MQVLLQGLTLEEKKPTQLYREMSSLAGKNVSDEFLQNMWTQRLPKQMQSILAVYQGETDEMLKLADRIGEINQGPSGSISAVSKLTATTRERTPSRLETMMEAMLKQLTDLTKAVHENSDRSRSRWRGRDQSRMRPRSTTPLPANGPKVCFFHKKFGQAATKCTTPCGFPTSGN